MEKPTEIRSNTNEKQSPPSNIKGARLLNAKTIVALATPYLGTTHEGVIFFKEALTKKAEELLDLLYDIEGETSDDILQSARPHLKLVDESIWKPILGASFIDLLQEYCAEEGLYRCTPQTLRRGAESILKNILKGDADKFARFLKWALIRDPSMMTKLLGRLSQ